MQSNSLEACQIDNNNQISIYYQGKLTIECLDRNLLRLFNAFSGANKPREFWKDLKNEIINAAFSDERLEIATSEAIKTTPINWFSMSSVLGYDKKIKLLTAYEYSAKASEYSANMIPVEVTGRLWYANKNDAEKAGLKLFIPKKL